MHNWKYNGIFRGEYKYLDNLFGRILMDFMDEKDSSLPQKCNETINLTAEFQCQWPDLGNKMEKDFSRFLDDFVNARGPQPHFITGWQFIQVPGKGRKNDGRPF